MDGIEKQVNKLIEDNFKQYMKGQQDELVIDAAVKPEELLAYMRKAVNGRSRLNLRAKLLEYETEMKPLIQSKAIRVLQDVFIENALYFFLHCQENCCDWILESYCDMRSEYLKSMLCLVLGFRGDVSMVPFLKREVARFESGYPDKEYSQGPLLALYELNARFG